MDGNKKKINNACTSLFHPFISDEEIWFTTLTPVQEDHRYRQSSRRHCHDGKFLYPRKNDIVIIGATIS
jgi:hypothetical protein